MAATGAGDQHSNSGIPCMHSFGFTPVEWLEDMTMAMESQKKEKKEKEKKKKYDNEKRFCGFRRQRSEE